MTVIVWDGRTLAADRQVNVGDLRFASCKIEKLNNGHVIAACGDHSRGCEVKEWYKQGADPSKWPESQTSDNYALLVVARGIGDLIFYEDRPFAVNVMSRFIAFGSGRDVAIGALAMGASAREAVEIVSMHINTCGLGVDSCTFVADACMGVEP